MNAKREDAGRARQEDDGLGMRFGHKDLPTSIVIQSWQGHDSIGRAAKEGYPGILSTGSLPRPASAYERSPLSHDPMPTGDTWLMISFIVARSS
ncbi:hypothetical protein OH492_12515 [Vibrio chagasii]|nr:hypothetical protein [Vibrio chagasii]